MDCVHCGDYYCTSKFGGTCPGTVHLDVHFTQCENTSGVSNLPTGPCSPPSIPVGFCWRVELRIACDGCGYPYSEALYASVEEYIAVDNVQQKVEFCRGPV